MKFATVLVLLAVALGIEASGLAWGAHYGPALSYAAVSGPAAHGAWGHGAWAAPAAYSAHGAWAAPAAWGAHGAWAAPAAVDVTHGALGHGAWAAPAVAVHTPAAVDVTHGAWGHGAWAAPAVAHHAAIAPAAHAWGHEGSYVAKTRGATHIAPLAGHAHSAAAINIQPAPGTV